ncbi:hypothetical protein P3S68_032574 [Capsicum galapagoense]
MSFMWMLCWAYIQYTSGLGPITFSQLGKHFPQVSGLIGLVCGVVVFFTSDGFNPPKKFNFLWLGLGFLMSITWTYILAEELISLLVSMGLILGISPSILGLTVLAWGNSLGDLVANVTLAKSGGPRRAQVALCGCYVGPIFNTLVGLGLPHFHNLESISLKLYSAN